MRILLFIGFMLCRTILPAQEKLKIETGKQFGVRDIPELNAILDSERKGRNRNIIVDFFSSTCSACFSSMPKMQRIQNKYGESVRVVLIGHKDKDIEKIYNRFKMKFGYTMDVVYDSVLFKKYDLPSMPFCIWIDGKGIVQATTGTENVDSASVEKFIAGKPFRIEKADIDITKPFLVNGNSGPDSNFLYKSVLARWDNTQPAIYPLTLQFSKHGKFFQAFNVSADDLYRYAYFGRPYWTHKSAAYSELLRPPVRIGKDTAAFQDIRFNYVFITTSNNADSLFLQRALQNDLSTYFGYAGRVVRMNAPCWKLVVLPGGKERLRSKYQQKSFNGSYTSVDYRGVAISHVLDLLLSSREDEFPIIDASGIDFPVDFNLEASLYDRESVVQALRLAGLDLVKSETPMKVILLEKN